MASSSDPNAVFLNVPFDGGYEKQFVALVAATIAIGRTPRCVLEVAETGTGRLKRILHHIRTCGVSVHDLSRVGLPARFNMPFELGLACAIAELSPPHAFILLERVEYRLQQTLSDINGRDPFIHGGSVRGIILCALDAMRAPSASPEVTDVYPLYRALAAVAEHLKRHTPRKKLFTRSNYLNLVAVGVERAVQLGLIAR